MKRAGNLIGRIADLDNLLLAFYKAQKGKKVQREVVEYRNSLHANLQKLSRQITNGNVEVGNYRKFTIIDPKKRVICAAAFGERVLHHAIMSVCQPYFERNLIYDTYATRVGKGVYSALERAKSAMPKYAYVAKLDVRKYFDSISHDRLKSLLRRLYKDNILLRILDQIIDSYEVRQGCGLPIGNLTSQYYANYYLSGLDHYAKEVLRIPVYIRYMDDILVFGTSHDEVFGFVSDIVDYANIRLGLVLKPPIIQNTSQPVSFLGYRLRSHTVMLSGRSKRRFVRKLRIYYQLLKKNLWNDCEFYQHVEPLLAFTQWSYSKKYRMKTIRTIEGLEL